MTMMNTDSQRELWVGMLASDALLYLLGTGKV